MAYSKNIKRLIIGLSKTQAPEKILDYITELEPDNSGYDSLKKTADTLLIPFTPVDWKGLKSDTPDPKTIRRWVLEEKSAATTTQVETNNMEQLAHIKYLQECAQRAIDALPPYLPDMGVYEEFNSFNMKLVQTMRRLVTGNSKWGDLSYHLDEEGKQIENLLSKFDEYLPGGSLRADLTEYKRDLEEAYMLIKTRGLKIISENADTSTWESNGLKPRCPDCPDQH